MTKFSKTPGAPKMPATQESFIDAAAKLPVVPGVYTWDNLDNTRRLPVFNLRLSDAERAKLKYISENTPMSMQEFCLSVLIPCIDAKIQELTGRKAPAVTAVENSKHKNR